MGIEFSLILTVVLAVLALVAVLIYAIVDRYGFAGRRRKVTDSRYPCTLSGDCGSVWGLSSNYVCDPKLKQCRVRAFVAASCSSDNDCLEATPKCVVGGLGRGRMCSVIPYAGGTLFADPTSGCNQGLIVNPSWNFCQYTLTGSCNSSDDCAQGACVNSRCQFLAPFEVCTVGNTYGDNQCAPSTYCASNPKHSLESHRCQPVGIAPGQPGAFCGTDNDCDNKDCYRGSTSDPFGVCASRTGLVGMACRQAAECALGLECDIPSGKVSGLCSLLDPTKQTLLTNCPSQYSIITANGCAGAVKPVPCSSDDICQNGCAVGNINLLVLAALGPNQDWLQIYPQPGRTDTLNVFSTMFVLSGDNKTFYLNPKYTMLISPSEINSSPPVEIYPTITLTTTPPTPPTPPVVDPRVCQPLVGGETIFSSFSNLTNSNVVFNVAYDPTDLSTSSVQAIILGEASSIDPSNPTVSFKISSDRLFSDFYVNQDPYSDTPTPYTEVYVNTNYHGPTSKRTWTLTPAESAAMPALWVGQALFLIPPPRIPETANVSGYLDNCLRFDTGNAYCVEPKQIFSHFFYYPSAGEVVISWKFNVLPTQGGGGVTTLVGMYEVERDRTTPGTGRVRRLIVSTLSLYVSTTSQSLETSTYTLPDASTIWAYRKEPAYSSSSSSVNVYTSVYSFTLIDFESNWPFSTRLVGPPSTQHDTAGLCSVTFSDRSHAKSEFSTLAPNGASIPGWSLPGHEGLYPVFNPRSYTRVQALSTVHNLTSLSGSGGTDWTSLTIFNTDSPALADVDMVVMSTAGSSSIIGILLAYNTTLDPAEAPPITVLITMRFGDTMPTSRYSFNNLHSGEIPFSFPTRMYSFYLTPDPEESGGGDNSAAHRVAFPPPQVELFPKIITDISSWVTPTPPTESQGFARHQVRTPWGSEVFTASLLPSSISPPMRFFRMPSTSLSTKGGDDVWIWGRDWVDKSSMRCVPLFFDNLGTVVAHMPGKTDPFWVSTAATACPPSVAELVLGMDHTFLATAPGGSEYSYQFSQGDPWNINPGAIISPPADITPPPSLVGRMCQTQGYQDGLLYRARPYVFDDETAARGGGGGSADGMNMPPAIQAILVQASSEVEPTDIQAIALGLTSLAGVQRYQDSLPLIGIGSIQALLSGRPSTHPLAPNVFGSSVEREIIWVGSECGVPLLAGGYRTLPCPVNPRAQVASIDSPYPTGCPDYALTSVASERKPLPICIIYRYLSTPPRLEMRLYDLRMTREGGAYTVQIQSDTVVQMNSSLATMSALYAPPAPATLSGSSMGYPGFSGGPAVVYTPCL